MTPDAAHTPKRRADAQRNRDRILGAARDAFAQSGSEVSMAEVSRRAGVGMATLYRNFPGRRELLEALYVGEVDAVCAAAAAPVDGTPVDALEAWLLSFAAFVASKHPIASELLKEADRDDPIFDGNRARVLAAGAPLLETAQSAGEVRADLSLEQALDLVIAVGAIRRDPAYVGPILRAALDGLRAPARPA